MGNTLSALFTNLPGSLFLASTGAIKVEGKISIGSEWETSSQNVLQGLFWSPVTWWIALSEDRSCQWQNACGGFINSTVMFTLSSNKYILWLYELCSVCNDPWWHEVTPKWSSQSFDNRPIEWDPNSNGVPNSQIFLCLQAMLSNCIPISPRPYTPPSLEPLDPCTHWTLTSPGPPTIPTHLNFLDWPPTPTHHPHTHTLPARNVCIVLVTIPLMWPPSLIEFQLIDKDINFDLNGNITSLHFSAIWKSAILGKKETKEVLAVVSNNANFWSLELTSPSIVETGPDWFCPVLCIWQVDSIRTYHVTSNLDWTLTKEVVQFRLNGLYKCNLDRILYSVEFPSVLK